MTTSFGIVSTYPPTECGLATFSAALLAALHSPHDHVGVISVVDDRQTNSPPEVEHQWVRGDTGSALAAAAYLNECHDVAIVQHEFGIFGGEDGADVLDLLAALTVPCIVVLHTVLESPSPQQARIVDEIAARAHTLVTMTHTAQERLVRHYAVDPATVRVVPHGAVDNRGQQGSLSHLALGTGRVVLTWGLLGDGKGIEWGIEAMAHLTDLRPPVRYHIVGETHPKVLQRSGERYREGLVRRAGELGVEDQVHFENRYVGSQELPAIIQRADVVLLPYDSCEQVTSGVLVEAVTAGKPVVSTDFPHARELLSSGAGLLVSRKNPVEMAGALRRVLTDRALASRMRAEADRLAPNLLWPAVAAQYRDIAAKALTRQQVGFSA